MRDFNPLKLLKAFKWSLSLFYEFTNSPKGYSPIHLSTLLLLFLPFFPISSVYAAPPQQSDYCYLPPFVTDPNTTPNVIFVYEKGDEIKKRAYRDQDSDTNIDNYSTTQTYAGFFDSTATYTYNSTKGWFEKTNTSATAPTGAGTGGNANYYSGNMLNWALMSTLDISRKVLAGFGWPKSSGADGNAGEAFTYKGCFAKPAGSKTTCEACADTSDCSGCNTNCQAPVSRGQTDVDNKDQDLPGVTVSLGGSNWTYGIYLSDGAGQNETGISIRVKAGTTAPSRTGQCKAADNCYDLISSGFVVMKFGKSCSNNSAKVCTNVGVQDNCSSGGVCSWETRYGIIQKYADKDQNHVYDSDAPRFGLRRWKTGTASDDRNSDMLCDSTSVASICTSTDRTEVLENLMGALSKEPTTDQDTPYLDIMMKYIVQYFRGDAKGDYLYDDLDDVYTQTSYNWATDPAKACRKTFIVFLTTGAAIDDGTASNYLSSTSCSSLDATLKTEFAQNTCYGFNEDLYTDTPKQNIRTYVVHTKFYGAAADTTTVDKLTYAAKTVGGGEYLPVSDPSNLQSKIEEALLNILSTSASASTVATLTTQTRESSTLTQAYFYPKRENTPIRWVGYLRLLWSDSGANLREDTTNTGWLDLKKDNILSFFYDPTLVAYKGRTFAVKNESPYLTIDTCDPSQTSKVTTKLNDNVLAIWNAQDRLLDRDPSNRTIKVGIGNASGVVPGSDCTTTTGAQGCNVFSTTLKSTLQPFWNFTSTCASGDTTRWCATSGDCDYCSDSSKLSTDVDNVALIGRDCSASTDCKYCELSASTVCTDSTTTGGCFLPDNGTCSGYCSTTTTQTCTSDSGCPSGETCGKAGNTCTGGSNPACSSCTIDGTSYSGDICCTVDKGDCVTTNLVCNTGISCTSDCTENDCAYQTIRFVMGYDYPRNSTPAVASPGKSFRVRRQCTTNTDCQPSGGTGTCGDKRCRATGVSCSPTDNCASDNPGDICVGTCSSASYDVTKTLKLGDIVYSTPRISPNSAVNGYDITYSDKSYKNFKESSTIKNAMPVVIVGANDGMVHAFQVSKIKDLSPASLSSGKDTTDDTPNDNDSYQTARFSDYPPDTDSAPDTDCTSGGCIGKELWAYIPYNAVPYLRWYCDEAYCHIPTVDARFTVIDASIDYNADEVVNTSDTDTMAANDRTCNTDGTKCVWRRLLIGAMGIGGRQIKVGSNTWSSSVFVLDITKPASPVLLWERPLPDGTLTAGVPSLVRLGGKPENGTWYLVIGSGPTSVTTNAVNYKTDRPNIYVFDLRTGSLSATLPVGTDVAENKGVAVGDMTAVDFDSDYQVDDIYFGTYGGTGASQKGKFYRLRIREGSGYDPVANWDIETVVDAGRPIYAAAEIAQDSNQNKWLYFGTGLYLSLEHVAPTAYCTSSTTVCTSDSDCASGTCDPVTGYLEYLYAVKEPDDCWKSGGTSCSTYTDAYFLNTSSIKFTKAKAVEAGCFCAGQQMSTITCDVNGNCTGSCGTNKVCSNNTTQSCSADSQCPTGAAGLCVENKVFLKVKDASITNTGPTSPYNCTNKTDTDAITCIENNINATNGCDGGKKACKGWRREIKGQKMFSRPFVAGGLADFTSFQPTSAVCSLGGNAHLISVHYTTGTAYVQPTIFVKGGTDGTGVSDIEIKASVNLGIGVPPLGESLVALPLAGDTYKVITQVSGGLTGTSMVPSLPAKGGYVLWIVK